MRWQIIAMMMVDGLGKEFGQSYQVSCMGPRQSLNRGNFIFAYRQSPTHRQALFACLLDVVYVINLPLPLAYPPPSALVSSSYSLSPIRPFNLLPGSSLASFSCASPSTSSSSDFFFSTRLQAIDSDNDECGWVLLPDDDVYGKSTIIAFFRSLLASLYVLKGLKPPFLWLDSYY